MCLVERMRKADSIPVDIYLFDMSLSVELTCFHSTTARYYYLHFGICKLFQEPDECLESGSERSE